MPETNPIEVFFSEMRDTHASGVAVKETSYYPCLSNLLNALGKQLKPKVRCVIHPRSIGAGLPDGALITPDQKSSENDPLAQGLVPSRGVIEVKGPQESLKDIASSEQVQRYLKKYGLVLVTNYREFVLVGRVNGQERELEAFSLASSEKDFWKAMATPKKLAGTLGASFHEYLARVLLQAAPLTTPKEVAWFLASYARDAKARIDATELPGLVAVRSALEQALGLKFEGEEGEHFFRSSLVQTLFYGVFSAWVLWSKRAGPKSKFNWHEAAWSLHVPMIKTLFEHLATPSKLQSLGLEEVLNWTETALNRVDRPTFFSNFAEEHAVQYFYEPFLAAFDPELRKRLGVWFTPPEIVQYMVARIDHVLREQLGLPNGFADPNVFVLDPCCGTGAFLVEVLRRIEATLKENGGDALTAEDVKTAAVERIFGFELLPAPFVVAHLQLGLLLQNLGAPLSDKLQERVGVYLTNALTGWNPPTGPKQKLMFPELEQERDAADLVKRDKKILVVLGNPPYYAFSGVSPEEEQGLVEPYKEGLNSKWKIRKFNLDELYARFLRLGERRIAEMSHKGVLAYISSYSYVSDPSFVVVRQRFCQQFDEVWIDSLNGDSRETGKLTPDGKPDPSVFSTEYNKEGIKLGTAVGIFVKKQAKHAGSTVRFRQFWGVNKREALVESLNSKHLNADYQVVLPAEGNRFSFRPTSASDDYKSWPSPLELSGIEPISGLQEMRRGALMNYNRDVLFERMQQYFDSTMPLTQLSEVLGGLAKHAGRFDPAKTRLRLLKEEKLSEQQLKRYALYPLDNRWCYYSKTRPLWNEPRPDLVNKTPAGETVLVIRRFAERPKEGRPTTATSALPDYHLLRPNVVAIPVTLTIGNSTPTITAQSSIFDHLPKEKAGRSANLSEKARRYVAAVTTVNPDEDLDLATSVRL